MPVAFLFCDDSLPGPDDPLRTASGGFGKRVDICPAYPLRSRSSDLSRPDLLLLPESKH
jgi:hypothetical protein